ATRSWPCLPRASPICLLDPHPGLAFAQQAAGDAARQAHLIAGNLGLAHINLVIRRTPDPAFIIITALRSHIDHDLPADIRRLILGLVLECPADRAAESLAARCDGDMGESTLIGLGLPDPLDRVGARGTRAKQECRAKEQ